MNAFYLDRKKKQFFLGVINIINYVFVFLFFNKATNELADIYKKKAVKTCEMMGKLRQNGVYFSHIFLLWNCGKCKVTVPCVTGTVGNAR